MFSKNQLILARKLLMAYESRHLTLATAESCTGGLIAALLTEIPGSSAVLERGFVTYSNAAKREVLGVRLVTLRKYGAVSEEVARAMAQGALKRSHARVAVSVTGIAGPAGGTKAKPVGLVYIAVATKRKVFAQEFRFKGTRRKIRLEAMRSVLGLLMAQLSR